MFLLSTHFFHYRMDLASSSQAKLKVKHVLSQLCLSQLHHPKVSQPISKNLQGCWSIRSLELPFQMFCRHLKLRESQLPTTTFSLLLMHPNSAIHSQVIPLSLHSDTYQILPILNPKYILKVASFPFLPLLYFRLAPSLIRAVSATFTHRKSHSLNCARVIFHKFKLTCHFSP